MKLNMPAKAERFTHEGAVASVINPEQELRRSVMACMLWEGTFYEDGMDIATRIKGLARSLPFATVAEMAVEARIEMKLRHVPLLLACALSDRKYGREMGNLLEDVIQRPDELTEFLAIYWRNGKKPLAKQVKRGLAAAFKKFNEYQLAKYNRSDKIKLRDVLFLSHAKPETPEQEALWKRLIANELATPDTWEVALSGGADKREAFERLMGERKLGALAFLRNLRNMVDANVDRSLIKDYLIRLDVDKVLPFRFVAAARHAPTLEPELEQAMLRALEYPEKLQGKTAIVVDNSGSMKDVLSKKSEMTRSDAACALAILVREISDDCVVIGFGSEAKIIPARRGFALRDAIKDGPGGGTYTQSALELADKAGFDRLILITDEQSHQAIKATEKPSYCINVGTYQNGISYGKGWTHIDGWSEAVVSYIRRAEESLR